MKQYVEKTNKSFKNNKITKYEKNCVKKSEKKFIILCIII